jgi:hypothetical protein
MDSMRIRHLKFALVLLCSVICLGSKAQAQAGPQASKDGPSLDETLKYINSKFVDGLIIKNSRVTVSDNHETLIYECDDFLYLKARHNADSARIIVLDPQRVDATSTWDGKIGVLLTCRGSATCAEAHSDTQADPKVIDSFRIDYYAPDDEGTKRLVKAYRHLLDLLQAEYRAKHDKDDPFAK